MSNVAAINETAELKINGESYEIPVVTGTENEVGLDIAKLRGQTKVITLDPGFKNTGSCKSAITYLDGENGVLRYRGYPIEQLAEKASFLEVAWLLIYGELPNEAQLSAFKSAVNDNTEVPEAVQGMLNALPADTHPMAMLSSTVCALTGFYPESLDPYRSDEAKDLTIARLMGKLPVLAAWGYRRSQGKSYVGPNRDLDYSSDFLTMMFSDNDGNYEVNKIISTALNTLLILHADHEQNCSASTVRIVGSAHASLYSSISAGINALWGPLHGGANQKVIEMLESIKNDGGDTEKWLNKAKDKEDPFRLMGFGHRVYKNFDPRARIIKGACDNVLDALGIDDPVLDIAKGLEQAALSDPYFKDRNLYPNVDFYSGIIYRALGIPVKMFTVMFALGRLPGWIAQWKEMRENGDPIGRPRQIYTGYNERNYVDISNR